MQRPSECHHKNLNTPFKMVCGVSLRGKGAAMAMFLKPCAPRVGNMFKAWLCTSKHQNDAFTSWYTLSKDTLSYHCMAFRAKLEDDYVKVFLNNNNYYYVLNSLIRLDLGVLP